MTDWQLTSQHALRMCKVMQPTFWSKDRQKGLVKPWATALERAAIPPRFIWKGITRWYSTHEGDERPTIGAIIGAARTEQEQYFLTPEGREFAKNQRLRLREERDQQLKNGTWKPRGSDG